MDVSNRTPPPSPDAVIAITFHPKLAQAKRLAARERLCGKLMRRTQRSPDRRPRRGQGAMQAAKLIKAYRLAGGTMPFIRR